MFLLVWQTVTHHLIFKITLFFFFNGLRNAGKLKEITGMRIGYDWKTNQGSNVVTLTPTYYLRYRGNWENYENLIN